MRKMVKTSINVQPYPETPSDLVFFCNLRVSHLSKVLRTLDHIDLLLAQDKATSPKLSQTFDWLDSGDQELQKRKITGCELQDWLHEVKNTFDQFSEITSDLAEAEGTYEQSLTNTSTKGQTVVANKRDFHEGVATLQRMKTQMDKGGLGYMRLLSDGNQVLGKPDGVAELFHLMSTFAS